MYKKIQTTTASVSTTTKYKDT